MYVRVIRYRWLAGRAHEGSRLARELAASADGRTGAHGVRVLTALQGGVETLVVFEWETREALDSHLASVTLERLAPWAVPLLHWRTDQSYVVEPATVGAATENAG